MERSAGEQTEAPARWDRRQVIVAGATISGLAWVAPTIISVDAAAAATVPPALAAGYVTLLFSDRVAVINTPANTVGPTITGFDGAYAVVVTPDGSAVYVTNYNANTVSVVDTATNAIVDTIVVGIGPIAMAVSPDGAFVYIANNEDSTVSVITTTNNTTVGSAIALAEFASPTDVVVSPDGHFVYVANGDGTVSVIDTTTNTVTETFTPDFGAAHLAISADGTQLVVTGSSNVVMVFDTSDFSAYAPRVFLPNGGTLTAVAITPAGFAYVISYANTFVAVIDLANVSLLTTISPVGVEPWGLAITRDGAFAYVTDRYLNSVTVISTVTNTIITTVDVGGPSAGVAF